MILEYLNGLVTLMLRFLTESDFGIYIAACFILGCISRLVFGLIRP